MGLRVGGLAGKRKDGGRERPSADRPDDPAGLAAAVGSSDVGLVTLGAGVPEQPVAGGARFVPQRSTMGRKIW